MFATVRIGEWMTEKEKKIYRVCLMGASPEGNNRGILALATSLIKLVHEVRPDAVISFLIGSRSPKSLEIDVSGIKTKIHIVNFRLSPRAHLQEHLLWIFLMVCLYRALPLRILRKKIVESNPFLATLLEADVVGDIRGGDSFSDIYGLKRFVVGSMTDVIVILMRKKLILLPQTYGPYDSFIAREIARFIMNGSMHILSRDRDSITLIKKLVRDQDERRRIEFCPDVAFIMDSVRPNDLDIQPSLMKDMNALVIGLNINGLMYHGGYTRDNMFGLKFSYKDFVNRLVSKLADETQADILLIPHTFGPPGNVNSDPDACWETMKAVPNAYRNRVHLVAREYNQYEIKGIISLCEFLIGSRMHACIAGLSQCIPTVGVAYSKKFIGIFDSIGLGNLVIDARVVDIETAIEQVVNHYKNREDIGNIIKDRVDIAKKKINETFRYILISN